MALHAQGLDEVEKVVDLDRVVDRRELLEQAQHHEARQGLRELAQVRELHDAGARMAADIAAELPDLGLLLVAALGEGLGLGRLGLLGGLGRGRLDVHEVRLDLGNELQGVELHLEVLIEGAYLGRGEVLQAAGFQVVHEA